MTMEQPWHDEEVLRDLYHAKGLTAEEVSNRLGCGYGTVIRWMDKHNIPRDSPGDGVQYPRLYDAEWLEKKYVDEGLSTQDIADVVGCSKPQAKRRVRDSDIDTRPAHPVCNDERVYDAEWMEKKYVSEGHSAQEIAEELGVGKTTVFRWLRRHDIPVHPHGASGEEHYRWKGGWDRYYGPNWNKQRDKRLEEDGYECVVCGVSNGEHRETRGCNLHVHHIERKESFRDEDGELDYERANRLENLITLCYKCHNRWEGIPLRPQS